MLKFITILLAASLALVTGAYARPDDAKKKAAGAKAGPPQQVKQQHVNAAPRVAPGPHVQAQHHSPNVNSANVNPAKIQRRELKEQQKDLHKSNVVPPN